MVANQLMVQGLASFLYQICVGCEEKGVVACSISAPREKCLQAITPLGCDYCMTYNGLSQMQLIACFDTAYRYVDISVAIYC